MNEQEKAIKVALATCDKSQRWLAKQIGMTPQNLNMRMKRASLKDADMHNIAEALGMEWKAEFIEKE